MTVTVAASSREAKHPLARRLLSLRVSIAPALATGLLVSFLYFRGWALSALRAQPTFVPKWALGLGYDLTAWGICCVGLGLLSARLESLRPAKAMALLLIVLNWINFELFRHIGQPFLPQALGVLSLGDAFDAYGAQMVWGLIHAGHFAGALVFPACLVLASGRPRGSRWRLPWLLAGLATSGLLVPVSIRYAFPAAVGFPRTLTWSFYGHGAFHWPAYLWHGDEADGLGQSLVELAPNELRQLHAVVDRYFDGRCHERPAPRYPLFRRSVACSEVGGSRSGGPRAVRASGVRPAGFEGRRPNLVFVHLESFRAASFDGLGHVWRDITPRLGALMQESAYFRRAFSNNIPTDRSLTSMLCSVPVPDVALSRLYRPRPRLTCLPELLRDAGYRNVRMSGIPSGFQKLGQFFAEHGVTETYGSVELQQAFPSPELEPLGERGYDSRMLYDERLFHAARVWIRQHRRTRPRQPFFLLLETMTNHVPWRLPDSARMPLERYRSLHVGAEETGTEETVRLHRTMRLTDDYVADFVDWFRQQEQGQLAAETLVLFYSDHPPWFPEPDFHRYPQAVKESWIPLFVWGLEAPLNRAYDYPVSLLDVAPTVLAWAGVRGSHAFVGKNLFDEGATRWFTFSVPGGRVYFADGDRWILDDGSRVRLRPDLRFEPLEGASVRFAFLGPGHVEREPVERSEAAWNLLERYVHRSLLVDRALRP